MAAGGNFVLDKGYRTTTALAKFVAVKLTGANPETVGAVAAITDQVVGVVQFAVSAAEVPRGKGAVVRTQGITVMVASGPIAIGAPVCITANGQAGPAATGARVIGMCVASPSTNLGDQISVLLTTAGHLSP